MRKYLKPKTEYSIKIGQHIRMWRDLKGIKQNELACKLGITSAALSQIENDIAELTMHRLEDIADALQLKPEQLFADPRHMGNATQTIEHATTNKELLHRIVVLMENMNNYFSGREK